MKECEKIKGCPKGYDLRTCMDFPNDCPLVHVTGGDIYIEPRQQTLFQDDIEDA